MLVSRGGDPLPHSKYRRSPLWYALWWGDVDADRAMLARKDVGNPRILNGKSPPDFEGKDTPFLAACGVDANAPLLCYMVGHGANLNDMQSGVPGLVIAAAEVAPSCVRALLECGADPNLSDHNGRTPLNAA